MSGEFFSAGAFHQRDERAIPISSRGAKPEPWQLPDVLEPVRSLSRHERAHYSYRKAILALIGDHSEDTGLELELSAAMAQRMRRPSNGIYVPLQLEPETRASLATTGGSTGGYTVQTEVSDLISLLRSRLVLERMGALFMGGLVGTVAFPYQASGSSGYWVAENPGTDVTQSDATFGQRVMSPHIYSATTAFSRKLLVQSSLDIEAFVRRDIAGKHAEAIDTAAINGSGTSNQPLGILKVTGIGDVACGSNGAIPTYPNIVDLETAVANANADAEQMRFLTTPAMRGKLKQVQTVANYGDFVWKDDTCLGYPGIVSTLVPSTLTKGSSGAVCHAIILADWSQVIIGAWGPLELLTDPYSQKKQGMVEVSSWQAVDVLLRQPAALAAIQDGKIS